MTAQRFIDILAEKAEYRDIAKKTKSKIKKVWSAVEKQAIELGFNPDGNAEDKKKFYDYVTSEVKKKTLGEHFEAYQKDSIKVLTKFKDIMKKI